MFLFDEGKYVTIRITVCHQFILFAFVNLQRNTLAKLHAPLDVFVFCLPQRKILFSYINPSNKSMLTFLILPVCGADCGKFFT